MKNHKVFKKSESKIIVLCIIITVAIFIMDSFIPLGVAGGVPYILVVIISFWSPNKRLTYYVAFAGTIFIILGFYSSPSGGELWKVIFNRSLAIWAIWITAILIVQRKTIQEEREKVLSELKVLSGLLPICASCKNIRDDKGYWRQIESYIRDHSEAEFSHGICPECTKKLYPNLGLKKNKK